MLAQPRVDQAFVEQRHIVGCGVQHRRIMVPIPRRTGVARLQTVQERRGRAVRGMALARHPRMRPLLDTRPFQFGGQPQRRPPSLPIGNAVQEPAEQQRGRMRVAEGAVGVGVADAEFTAAVV